MAKNKDLEFEDDDLGLDLELDDIDFGDGNATPPPKNAREAVTRSLKDVGSGIIGSVTDNPLETATAIAKKSLPPEISSEVNDILDVATSTKEALVDAAGEVKRTSAATIKNLNKLMPKGGRISAMLDKIYDKLGGEETTSGPSKEEIENANIASSIVTALGEQSKLEHVNGMIRDSVENKRHQTTTQIMSNIVAETEHVRKFHYEITNSYYRKSLELQYKSLFVSKEQLEVLKTSTARFTNQFESIVHNTGLPDILKARSSEKLKETFKQHMYDEVKDTVFQNFNPMQNLKENLVNRIKSEIGSFKDAMDGVNTGLEQLGDLAGDDSGLGVSKSNMVGGMIGEFIRDKVFGTIGKRVSKTDAGKNIIKNVKNFTADPKAGLRNLANNLNDTPVVGSALSGVTGFLGDMIDSPSINKAFIPKTDLNGAALFNGRTQDSIVKVIPGLLSKILAEVTYIGKGGQAAHGNKSSSEYELNYNFKTGSFENVKDVASNVMSRVTTKNNKVIVKHLPTIVNYLEKVAKVKLSKELKSVIEKGIVSEAYNPNGAFSAAMFVDSNFVKKYVPKSEFAKYKSFMVKFEKGAKDDPATVYGGINNSLTSLKKGIVGYGAEVEDLHYRGLGHLTDGMGLNAINPQTGESEYSDKLGAAKSMSGWFDTSRKDKQKLLDEEVGVAEYNRRKKLEEEEKKKSSTGKFFSAAKDKLNSTKKKLTKSEIKAEKEEQRLKDLSNINISPDESIGYFSSGGFTGKPKDGHVDHTGKEQAGIVHKNEAVIPEKTLFSSKYLIRMVNKFLPSNKQIPESVVSEASDTNDASVIKDTLDAISKENPGTITKDFINKVTEGIKDNSTKAKDNFTIENVKQQVSKIKGLSKEQAEKLEDYLLTNKDMNVWKLIDRDASKFLDKIAKKGEDLGDKIFGSTLWNSSKSLINKTGRKASKKVSDIANKGEEKALGIMDSITSMFNNDSNSITKSKSKKAKSNNSGFIDGIKNLKAGDVYDGFRSTAETVTNKYDGIKEFLSTQYNKKMFKGVNIDLITKDIGNLLTKGKSVVSTVDKTTIYKLTDSLIIGGDKLYKHLSSIDFKGNAEAMLNEALNYNAENGVIGIVDKVNSKLESTSIKNKYIIESDEYSAKDIVSGITKRLNTLKDDGKDYYTKFSLKETKSDIAIHGKKLIDKLLRKARPIEELKKEFYTSWEYENDKSTNFYKWIDENNYSIKDGESTIRKLFKKTREWDRKIMLGGAKLLGKGAWGATKMVGSVPLSLGKLGLNATGGLYNLGRKIPGLGGLPAYKAIKGGGGMLGKAAGKTLGGTSWLLKEMFNISNPNGSEYEKHKAGLENYYKEKEAGEKEAKANKPDGMFKKLNKGLGKFMFGPYNAGKKIKDVIKGDNIKGQKSGDPEVDSFTGYASNLLKGSIATITNIFTKKKKEAEESGKPRKGSWKDRISSLFTKNPDGKENKSLGKFFKDNKKGIAVSLGMLGVVGLLKAMNVSFEDVKNFGKGIWDGIVSVKNVLVNVYNAVKPIVGAVIDMGMWVGKGIVKMASTVGSWVLKLIPDWLLPDSMKSTNAKKEPKPKLDANGQPVIDENGKPVMEEDTESGNGSSSAGKAVGYGIAGYAAYKVGKGVYNVGKGIYNTGKKVVNTVKGAYNLGKKVVGGVTNVGKKVVGGVKAVASGTQAVASTAANAGAKVAGAVPDKKGIAKKIISTLENFKSTILKKLGPKAGKKMVATLVGKIAARAVPFLGWGLLIYDAAMVIKYMTVDNMEFKSAVSKAVIGFDLFNDDEPMLDENGEVIKPDENIPPVEEEEETKEDKKEDKKEEETAEEKEKRLKEDKYISKSNMDKLFDNATKDSSVKKEEKQEPGGLLGILSKMFGKGTEFVNNAAASTTQYMHDTYGKVKEVSGAMWDKIKNLDIGGISAYFESGGRGPGTVSSGNGDFGGVSYGTHQLASKTGTLKKYLNSSVYGKEFNGLVPGSPQFTAKWKEIAAREPDKFAHDQEDFIKKTHYLPQVNKLSKSGLDVTSKSPALQSAVYSAAVQFGPGTGLIQNAVSANNIDYNAPDEEIIKSIYDYKKKNNDKLFKSSSPAVRKGTLNRAVNEENMVLKLLKESGGSVGALHKEVGIDLANKPIVPSTDNVSDVKTSSSDAKTSSGMPEIQVSNSYVDTTTVDKQPVVTTPPVNKPATLETANKNDSNTVTIDKSNNNLKGIEDINITLVKSLETQIRMANTLDKILEVSSRNMSPEEAKKIANSNKSKSSSELPRPTVNMSKGA